MRPTGHQVTPRLHAQGHQVTPHLRGPFRVGVSGDSSPSRTGVSGPLAFARFSVEVYFMHREDALSPWMRERAESSTHGSRWWGAVIMWIRECALHTTAADEGLLSCEFECALHTTAADEGLLSCELECALHMTAADEGLLSCEFECALHTTAADEGLLSCELESVLYTRQPLMRGCYHVNERVCSTQDSRWWGAGIVWMSEELSDCAFHTAERRLRWGLHA